ncbi:short-chain dehydrogenase/reductase [Pseudonocardia bannensis]|uniref:SDR family NAD(P)-dependent oxidoreductase n=1 Tax=Pseudonocardia bannensis TaxID=630973 RepID=A0A848DC45_9PSEU|nr:short-chain dehydrogenase/reductase [Pseudonocardia bannensis]NMH90075.1 SDR family NAD(P)-dependent oxidoreductase [Pseudonocardia bannensis]
MTDFPVRDKVVFLTGAAGGIGRATAQALHARGARVVLTDLRQEDVDRVAASLGADRTLALAADVTDRASLDAAVAAAVERFGGIDVVFANAGIAADPPCTIAAIDEDVFEHVVDVDLLGVWRTVKAALPQVIARRGHVLVVASAYAFVNGMANAPYAVSKAGAEMFGRSLRAELSSTGATAGVLYPGWVDTAIAKVAFGGNPIVTRLRERAMPGPLGQAIRPEEVAQAALAGIERRAARVIVPKRWAALSVLRGIVNPLLDRKIEGDRTLQALVGELDAAARAAREPR